VPIALVSDIHGNDRALAAVVAELERLGVERAVCLGDAVQGGDEPRQVLDRLAALEWPTVLGNADDFLLEVPSNPAEEITTRHLEKRTWTLAQLDSAHLDRIRGFPRTVELCGVLAFHGSPRSYDDVLLPDTDDDSPWRTDGFEVLAGGHTHRQWTRVIAGALYVNPGSVGVSDDGLAQFAILTGASVSFLRVPWSGR
jgi:predicted phosphodiesterase